MKDRIVITLKVALLYGLGLFIGMCATMGYMS